MPIERLAQVAFLYGREYGKWEAGAIEEIELPEDEAIGIGCGWWPTR